MATIYLAAHANAEKGEAAPLTGAGVEQARSLGKWIGRNIPELSTAATSSAWSAYDTIVTAFEDTHFDADLIHIDSRLNDLSHRKAEDTQAVGDRMLKWVQEAVNEYGEHAAILAGTHEMSIRCLAARVFRASDHDMRGYRVANGSMNILTINRSAYPTMDLDVDLSH